MGTFVLVHGSWHGGWCWRDVASLLRSDGHVVHAPTLTGLSDRAHLSDQASLGVHIEDVTSLLFAEDVEDAVLVGHSYAGLVVTGAAIRAPDRLCMVVYLDTYLPLGAESWFDLHDDPAAERQKMIDAGGVRPPVPAAVLGIEDPEMQAWVDARLTPQPIATYDERLEAGADGLRVDAAYIHCTRGVFAGLTARAAALARAQGWDVTEIDAGHDVMLTAAEPLVRILEGYAT